MSVRIYTILKAPDYSEWYRLQPFKEKAQIEDRLLKIQNEGYFGVHKCVDANQTIWELREWGKGKKDLLCIYSSSKNIAPFMRGIKMAKAKTLNKRKKSIDTHRN